MGGWWARLFRKRIRRPCVGAHQLRTVVLRGLDGTPTKYTMCKKCG